MHNCNLSVSKLPFVIAITSSRTLADFHSIIQPTAILPISLVNRVSVASELRQRVDTDGSDAMHVQLQQQQHLQLSVPGVATFCVAVVSPRSISVVCSSMDEDSMSVSNGTVRWRGCVHYSVYRGFRCNVAQHE